ncbi:hypothetical protein L3Q82_016717, partial [Scortum barcoo]
NVAWLRGTAELLEVKMHLQEVGPGKYRNSNITVHLGHYSQSGPNSHDVTRGVEQTTCHPSYFFPFNDICLLKLSAPVNLTDYIFPVCLASENSTFYTGVSTWVTGWGLNENNTFPDILQEVNVPVVGNNECRCSYGSDITEDMICTGLRDGGKGPCSGDAGAPVVAKKCSSWVQVGIASFSTGCALPNYPTVYTRVSQYQEWINNVTGSSQPGYVTFISSGVDSDADFNCSSIPPPTTTPSPPPVTCKDECGLAPRNTRITGGEDASPGSWPWQVSLNHSVYGVVCGGSLITDQWVMTDARCVFGNEHRMNSCSSLSSKSNLSNFMVHLGQHSQSGPNSHEVTRGVEQVTCHPSYSYLNNRNCLLKLSAPVNLTDYIFPICLASKNSTFYTGVSTWVTGWGRNENNTFPDILQEVNVPVVGNNECRCSYGSYITEDVICTGLRDGRKGPCFGDEGAPLVAKKDSSWFQIGILSSGCPFSGSPAVYTRVSHYQEWINSITGSSQPGYVTFISPGVDSDADFNCSSKPPPTTSPSPPPVTDRDGNSVFDSGENVIYFSHSTHFISLCVLVLSLFALLGDA